MILQAAAAKNAGKIERLFVVGCLSERYADELRAELPEVDEFFGARTWDGIVRALGAAEDPALETERHLTTPKHYAYLKISEGCNWKCGYCAIPLIRGGHVSVPMERLEEEARKLAAGGVKELIVIAQDTTYYGLDLYGRRMLAELLRRLCRIGGIEWIRLHYAYPTAFPDEVIEVMASEPKICKYLDIPFQHISDAQLSAMQRRHTKADAYALISRLRGAIPDLALRSWSAIPARRRPISPSWNSSCATYASSGWGSSPIRRRKAPIRRKNCRTTFRRRSNSSASNGSWRFRTKYRSKTTCVASAGPSGC